MRLRSQRRAGKSARRSVHPAVGSPPIKPDPAKRAKKAKRKNVVNRDRQDQKKAHRRRQGYKMAICVNDMHAPLTDHAAVSAVMECAEDQQPEVWANLGDLLDGEAVSQWLKDPAHLNGLQYELDYARNHWADVRQLLPHTRLIYCEGNHEERLPIWITKNPGLGGLDCLTVPKLMQLDKYGVQWFTRNQRCWLGKLLLIHGSAASINSGYSASAEMRKRRCNGISGHCHRMAVVYHRGELDTLTWAENGHLMRLEDVGYLRGSSANWQQGFSVIYYTDDWFQVCPVPIIDRKFVFDGKLYRCKDSA